MLLCTLLHFMQIYIVISISICLIYIHIDHHPQIADQIKVNRDFQCACPLSQGRVRHFKFVTHVNPEDTVGCMSWWLLIDDGFIYGGKQTRHKFQQPMLEKSSGSCLWMCYIQGFWWWESLIVHLFALYKSMEEIARGYFIDKLHGGQP